ncbi:hypothetical protein ACP4OV_025479 [Aristida adscensionis]
MQLEKWRSPLRRREAADALPHLQLRGPHGVCTLAARCDAKGHAADQRLLRFAEVLDRVLACFDTCLLRPLGAMPAPRRRGWGRWWWLPRLEEEEEGGGRLAPGAEARELLALWSERTTELGVRTAHGERRNMRREKGERNAPQGEGGEKTR